jgi:arsenite-transporting ATPase
VRLVFLTGKGGVGKTTTAAATAALAAAHGHRTLVLSADPAHSLGDVLGVPLQPAPTAAPTAGAGDAEPHEPPARRSRRRAEAEAPPRGAPRPVAPRLDALEVDARATLDRHWGSIRDYLVSLFRHSGIEGVIADELALLPGAEELAALLAVEDAARSGAYDLCVVDCAPTGSTLRLVTLPEAASRAVRLLLRVQRAAAALVTPLARALVPVPLPGPEVFRDVDRLLYERLARLRSRLLSADTSVRLVVTPERMVIDEALRAHTDLSLFELPCDAVVMNRLYPPEVAAEPFFESWTRFQEERLAEVREDFAPLPVLAAPLAPEEVVGVDALEAHGALIFGGLDPTARLCDAPRLRFARGRGEYRVELPLPHARREALDVAKLDDALFVSSGSRRRAIPLPRKLAALSLVGARLDDGWLVVRLAAPGAAR